MFAQGDNPRRIVTTEGKGHGARLKVGRPAESSGTQNARYEGKSVAARAIAGWAASSEGCSPGMAWIRLRSPQVPCPYGEMGPSEASLAEAGREPAPALHRRNGEGHGAHLKVGRLAESSGTQNARYEGKSVAARAIAGLAASSQGCSPGMAWIRLRSPQVPCPYGEMGGRARQASRKRGGSPSVRVRLRRNERQCAHLKVGATKPREPARCRRYVQRVPQNRTGHEMRATNARTLGGKRDSSSRRGGTPRNDKQARLGTRNQRGGSAESTRPA